MTSRIIPGLILALAAPTSFAQDLGLGTLTTDPPGVDILGFELALTGPSGSPSYAAQATLEYRTAGSSQWQRAPDMMRVRPDLDSDLSRDEAFAGPIWDLEPATVYEIRITVTDPSLGTEVVTTTASTRALPRERSGEPADVVIEAADSPSESQIQDILDAAGPGDIIEIRGRHVVDELQLHPNGTPSDPIYLRGDGTGVLEDTAAGRVLTAVGDHWVVEDLTLIANPDDDNYVVRVDGREDGADSGRNPLTGFTLRRCRVSGQRGLRAWEGSDSEIYSVTVYDNVLEGRWSWNEIVTLVNNGTINTTWGDTGMRMTGQGHSVFHNTFSGFGDSIKTDRQTAIFNTTINYTRNKVLWGGDDGIELDDAVRNVVMYQNLIMNTGTGGSKQPNFVTAGPNYMVRNVLVNHYLRPFKLNDGPNGVRLIHNTAINTNGEQGNRFWVQHNNGTVENLDVLNNLFVHVNHESGDRLIKFDANLEFERWDGNAYWPDGVFEFNYFNNSSNFAEAQGDPDGPAGYDGANFEESGALLSEQPFLNGLPLVGTDWRTRVMDFDPSIKVGSEAASGAIPIPGYSSVSRGAVDAGTSPPEYGARVGAPQPVVRPAPPENLTTEQ